MTKFRPKPELPNVLHGLNFEVQPGEKVQQRYGPAYLLLMLRNVDWCIRQDRFWKEYTRALVLPIRGGDRRKNRYRWR